MIRKNEMMCCFGVNVMCKNRSVSLLLFLLYQDSCMKEVYGDVLTCLSDIQKSRVVLISSHVRC
jgi:hypothetical protein